MFIELIDLLRCPVPHAEDSWLVAAFSRMNGRFIIEGKLGCPVCNASYLIRDGVALFAPSSHSASTDRPAVSAVSSDETIRVAALLGLTATGKTVLLEGSAAAVAPSLVELTEAQAIAVNANSPVPETERVASVTSAGRLPLASGSVDGVMLTGEGGETQAAGGEIARVLRQGGRLVAPASFKAVGNFREIARDDRNIVLESVGELVTLRR